MAQFHRSWTRPAIAIAALLALVFAWVFVGAMRELLADRDASAVTTIGTAQVDHILGPRDFDARGGASGSDFDVAADALVVPAGNALFAVEHFDEAQIRKFDLAGGPPESFALDRDGTLLTIADGYFGTLDAEGKFTRAVPLPFQNMHVAPSSHRGAVYLFGGSASNYRLYRFLADGTLQIVLEIDEPIVAVADNAANIYAATANAILRIKAKTPDVLFLAPKDFSGPLRSLAVAADGLVLFSTDTKVYALAGPNALSVVNDAGGTLRLRDGKLYVFDPARKILFRLSPASTQLLSGTSQ